MVKYLIFYISWKNYELAWNLPWQELLRRHAGSSRRQAGVPFMYVVLVGIIGIILGFLLKRTWPEWLAAMRSIVESNKKYVKCGKTKPKIVVLLSCIAPTNLECVVKSRYLLWAIAIIDSGQICIMGTVLVSDVLHVINSLAPPLVVSMLSHGTIIVSSIFWT